MTDTADREEAVVRVRAYVESWEGFEPSVTISDERDPNSLYLGDLRLLLSGGEGGGHLAKDALPRGETRPDTPSQPSAVIAAGRALEIITTALRSYCLTGGLDPNETEKLAENLANIATVLARTAAPQDRERLLDALASAREYVADAASGTPRKALVAAQDLLEIDSVLGFAPEQALKLLDEAALSPRSADGLGSLAAKDGAAAPPQAPVAGSEDSASEVVWRCFHCDEAFADPAAAAEHFGSFEDCTPICKVGAARFRQMEDELASWRSESDTASKEFYALGAKHSTALREAEQQGYDKGLADGLALPRQKVSAAPPHHGKDALSVRPNTNPSSKPREES